MVTMPQCGGIKDGGGWSGLRKDGNRKSRHTPLSYSPKRNALPKIETSGNSRSGSGIKQRKGFIIEDIVNENIVEEDLLSDDIRSKPK
jgi:hypothetical protein